MYFAKQKTILIHVPKTAGNALAKLLVRHSSDFLVVDGHRDGRDRFEIRGDVTPHKHATLQDYHDALGDDLFQHDIAITVRKPLARAVSLFFSPSENLKLPVRARLVESAARLLSVPVQFPPEAWSYREPRFSLPAFRRFAESALSICDHLRVSGRLVQPDFILRQEHLSEDAGSFFQHLGLRLQVPKNKINATPAAAERIEAILADPRVNAICDEVFAEDLELLQSHYDA